MKIIQPTDPPQHDFIASAIPVGTVFTGTLHADKSYIPKARSGTFLKLAGCIVDLHTYWMDGCGQSLYVRVTGYRPFPDATLILDPASSSSSEAK